jgi:hypothetical protein
MRGFDAPGVGRATWNPANQQAETTKASRVLHSLKLTKPNAESTDLVIHVGVGRSSVLVRQRRPLLFLVRSMAD